MNKQTTPVPADGIPLDPARCFKEKEIAHTLLAQIFNVVRSIEAFENLIDSTNAVEERILMSLVGEPKTSVFKSYLLSIHVGLHNLLSKQPVEIWDRYFATMMMYYPHLDRWHKVVKGENTVITLTTRFLHLRFTVEQIQRLKETPFEFDNDEGKTH